MGRLAREGRLTLQASREPDAPTCRLYLISPLRVDDAGAFARLLAAALEGGDVGAFQLRMKEAPEAAIEAAVQAIRPLLAARGAPLILNDDPGLAVRLGCDGVHVGQGDAPCREARRIVGPERIVGVTCHSSRHLAMEAAEAGADYVAFGAFFPTVSKTPGAWADLEVLDVWQETMLVPCVAIGGLSPHNCAPIVAAGADFIAASAAIWGEPDGPGAAVAAFEAAIAEGLAARARRLASPKAGR